MKRYSNLWERLISFPNLLHAARAARHRKRHRPNVASFHFHLERELCRLQDELRQKTYTPLPYHTFHIVHPKPRLISAAAYRDRVVHHALCRVLEPVFEPVFIFDCYANRKGKGSHAAVNRFTHFARQHRYALHCDVSKYFPSIDHELLKQALRQKVKDADVLWLADRILDHSNPQEPVQEWFPGDDLLTPAERRRGLPLGNQTSQFFANVFLSPFDHFVKQTLRVPGYLRYVDDFVLFGDDPRQLAELREQCREFLAGLRLRLHPRKAVLSRVEDGVRFLGYRIFPEHRLLPRSSVTRMKRRLRALRSAARQGKLTRAEVRQRIASWLGHARHADVFGLCRWLCRPMNSRGTVA